MVSRIGERLNLTSLRYQTIPDTLEAIGLPTDDVYVLLGRAGIGLLGAVRGRCTGTLEWRIFAGRGGSGRKWPEA